MKNLNALSIGHPEARRLSGRGTSQMRLAIVWFNSRYHESRAASCLVRVISSSIARSLASLGMTDVRME